MGWDPATRAYTARRIAEGKSMPEILRCLKRYIARELYPLLAHNPTLPPPTLGTGGSRSEPATDPPSGERRSPAGPERSAGPRPQAGLTVAGGGAFRSGQVVSSPDKPQFAARPPAAAVEHQSELAGENLPTPMAGRPAGAKKGARR